MWSLGEVAEALNVNGWLCMEDFSELLVAVMLHVILNF